ncbi:hypothetical protein ACVWVZ_004764 [Pseudomonas tolaasii]|nr:hypothetical protein [Pseudomonas tolaasii]
MFKPLGQGAPANAFEYRGVPVRFNYRVEVREEKVLEMDIFGVLPGEASETRFHRLIGPWPTRDEALAAAQDWARSWLNIVLGKGAKE